MSSAPAGPSSTQSNPALDCRLAASRPSPARVVGWLGDQGMAISLTSPGALPTGACGVAAFNDPNAPSSNLIAAYPDAESAGAAAAAPAQSPAGPRLKFAEGIYVMILDPALAGLKVQYQAMLAGFVAQTNPAVVVTPLSTPSTTTPVPTTRPRASTRK